MESPSTQLVIRLSVNKVNIADDNYLEQPIFQRCLCWELNLWELNLWTKPLNYFTIWNRRQPI